MRAIDELLKMKWETAIQLENALHKLKDFKAQYFTVCLIDLPDLPKDHPKTIKIAEKLDTMYKNIVLAEEKLDKIAKNVEKLNLLIKSIDSRASSGL